MRKWKEIAMGHLHRGGSIGNGEEIVSLSTPVLMLFPLNNVCHKSCGHDTKSNMLPFLSFSLHLIIQWPNFSISLLSKSLHVSHVVYYFFIEVTFNLACIASSVFVISSRCSLWEPELFTLPQNTHYIFSKGCPLRNTLPLTCHL